MREIKKGIGSQRERERERERDRERERERERETKRDRERESFQEKAFRCSGNGGVLIQVYVTECLSDPNNTCKLGYRNVSWNSSKKNFKRPNI